MRAGPAKLQPAIPACPPRISLKICLISPFEAIFFPPRPWKSGLCMKDKSKRPNFAR
jgi:hypothetical protein